MAVRPSAETVGDAGENPVPSRSGWADDDRGGGGAGEGLGGGGIGRIARLCKFRAGDREEFCGAAGCDAIRGSLRIIAPKADGERRPQRVGQLLGRGERLEGIL